MPGRLGGIPFVILGFLCNPFLTSAECASTLGILKPGNKVNEVADRLPQSGIQFQAVFRP